MSASSSTSSSETVGARHRTYLRRLLAALFVFSALVFAAGAYVQPFYGDITRVGGYSEREFGWNGTQPGFESPLFSMGAYDRYFDVIVIGDSFSFNGSPLQWQNFFAATSGMTILTLDVRKTSPEDVLSSPTFKSSPPRLLVFERVERLFMQSVKPAACPQLASDLLRQAPPAEMPRLAKAPASIKRQYRLGDYFRYGYPFALAYRAALRTMREPADVSVRAYPLKNAEVFTSHRSDLLLVYSEELKARPWSDQQLAMAKCFLLDLQARTEANGTTGFAAMVPPDRLTAYASQLARPESAPPSRLHELADRRLKLIELEAPIREKIAAGVKDVYLPNDTHWGAEGHMVAAAALMAHVKSLPGDR